MRAIALTKDQTLCGPELNSAEEAVACIRWWRSEGIKTAQGHVAPMQIDYCEIHKVAFG